MDLNEIREMAATALERNPENVGAQQILIETEKVYALRSIADALNQIWSSLPSSWPSP